MRIINAIYEIEKSLMMFRARQMRQNDVDVIAFKNRFMMKHVHINELMNKLFTPAKICQN